jgi:hypothetical protein
MNVQAALQMPPERLGQAQHDSMLGRGLQPRPDVHANPGLQIV